MPIIVSILFIGLYVSFFLARRNKLSIGDSRTRKLRLFNIGLLILLLILVLLAINNTYLRGYWTTKFLIWLFLLSTMTLYGFGHRPIMKKIEKAYYGLIFYFPLVIVPFLFNPFIGLSILFGISSYVIGDSANIQYSDSKFRIENTFSGVLAPARPPTLIVKYGPLEYKEAPLEMHYIENIDSIDIKEIDLHNIRITFFFQGKYEEYKSPFELAVKLTN